MPLDDLPGEIIVPTREEEVAKRKRDYLVRKSDLDPADPELDDRARVGADSTMPLYAAAKIIGQNCVLEDAQGEKAVKKYGERYGIEGPNPAFGASGAVEIDASAGGTTIHTDDELIHEPTGAIFIVTTPTKSYADEDPCDIRGTSSGPETNLPPGTVLKWRQGRPGCGPAAVVIEQSDGSGLSGARAAETALEYQQRIRSELKDKPASGNDADYRSTAQKTPNIGIQKVFAYPCITGGGTTAVTCTMMPARPGGSRIPNSTQIAAAEAHTVGSMPVDDGAYFFLLVEEPADVVYEVTWDEDAVGWADVVQWPPYYAIAGTPAGVVVSGSPTATAFALSAADYTGIAQPEIGQTLAFFDSANGEFVAKRILAVVGSGPWLVNVDVSNAVSDTVYIPIVGQRVMPWSDSLNALLPKLFTYFDGIGPGEQVASFYDEGRRQRRQPQAPKDWPHTLTRKGLETALDVPEVGDGGVLEGDGLAPSVGSPGALSYMLKLRYVSVFPE